VQSPLDRLRDDAAASDASNDLANPVSSSRRSVWALADQGIVSLGNCTTNILLARSLAVAEFGIFALLLEAMLFLNSLQAALVIYPLSVRGAILDRDGLRRLAGTCLMLTFALALPLGLAVIFAGNAVDSLGTGLLCAIALAAGQCQETLRRAMMSHGGQRRALPGDAVSYLGQAALVLMLSVAGVLTVNTAFAVMAFTSGAAVIVQAIQIGPRFTFRPRELMKTGSDFWQLGRWVLMGNLTLIITTLGCSWTLVYFHGTDAVGRFQALANLMKLSNPLTICMAGLIVPAAARAFRTDGLDAAKSIAKKYGLLTGGVIAPYFLFLVLLPTTSIHLLYGAASSYAGLGNQLRAFVVWYAALLVAQVVGCLLNAIEQSKRSFVAQVAQTAAIIVIALPLTAIYGLDGLMAGGVIANLVMAAAYLSMIRRIDEPPIVLHSRKVTHENHAARLAA
ncbi:MAG: hypothetical protein H7144_08765, partial [Burkholderiales bacterium]|nr:hypothetical protein [Phycisphaerae bacterium]